MAQTRREYLRQRAADRALSRRIDKSGKRAQVRALTTGAKRCPHCGGAMRRLSPGSPFYRCDGCGAPIDPPQDAA